MKGEGSMDNQKCASCSNDEIIKLSNIDITLIRKLFGHLGFIFELLFLASGEID
jgi:hypothetical protein